MPIRVNIHEAGALRNQRYAFTDRFTLVSELLQNARRAGARRIEVRYDEPTQSLQVSDDGGGIQDFQALLSLHASGWSPALREAEQAFGVGFSQCLYSARRCRVTSGAQQVDFDCAAALAQQPIEVTNTDASLPGTCVHLQGVTLPDWQARIERLCVGFPVPVWLNGQELPRPLGLDALDTQASAIGQVFLLGRHDGWSNTDLMVFLQGLCVWRSPYSVVTQVNVVHLDSRQFLARLPDRDKLVDEDVQLARIQATVQHAWHQVLLGRLQQLDELHFLERYYRSVQRWQQNALLNGLTLLPREVCQRIEHYPEQTEAGWERYLQPCTAPVSRQAIEDGTVQLIALSPLDGSNAARWMLARACGAVRCDRTALHADHWVQRHVQSLDDLPVEVTARGALQQAAFHGRWVDAMVVLCDVVRIAMGQTCIDLVDEGLFHDGVVYIPANAWSGKAVRQASRFIDGYQHVHDADAQAEEEALAQLIQHVRCRDPLPTLRSLLGDLHLERYPALQEQTFVLQVGDQDHALVVECLATAGGAHAQS